MWSTSLRTAIYSAALVEYLSCGSLLTLEQASELLGSEPFAAESLIMLKRSCLRSKRRMGR